MRGWFGAPQLIIVQNLYMGHELGVLTRKVIGHCCCLPAGFVQTRIAL